MNRKINGVREVFKELKPFKYKLIISSFLSIVATVASLASPLLVREISRLIIEVTRSGSEWNFQEIIYYGIIAISLYICSFIFSVVSEFIIQSITAKFGFSLRKKMYGKINSLSISRFDNRDAGDIISRITNDVDLLENSISFTFANIFSSVMIFVGSMTILFIFSWGLGLILLVALPISFISISLIAKKLRKFYDGQQRYLSEVTSVCEESYDARMLIRSFDANETFKKKFDRNNKELKYYTYKTNKYCELLSPFMQFFGNFVFAIICLVVGVLVGSDAGSPEEVASMVAAITYGTQLLMPLALIAQLLNASKKISVAGTRIFALLNEENEPDESDKTTTIKNVKGLIQFKNVSFGYTKKTIIKNFSIDIKPGEKIAIVGPTGSGKTTLMSLLMRFYEINKGKIFIDGIDIQDMNRNYVRSLFGMVLQDTWVFEGSFMDNLKYTRDYVSDATVYKVCKETYCDDFIAHAGGYNAKISDNSSLSGGQLQLLTIARAMIQNAPMLILDEATSNVDERTEVLIQDAINKITKNRTSFIIAHRLSTIKNADKIIMMENGKIVEVGKHNELIKKKGSYAELYNSQYQNKF